MEPDPAPPILAFVEHLGQVLPTPTLSLGDMLEVAWSLTSFCGDIALDKSMV